MKHKNNLKFKLYKISLVVLITFCTIALNLFYHQKLYSEENDSSSVTGINTNDKGRINSVYYPSFQSPSQTINNASSESEASETTGSVTISYSAQKGGFVYIDANGKEVLLSISDLFGPNANASLLVYLKIENGTALVVYFSNSNTQTKTIYLVRKYKSGTSIKEWEYDVSSRQIIYFHTTGNLIGKPDYVVQENGGWFRWADNNSLDPEHTDQIQHLGWHTQEGRQFAEHFLAQNYFYDTNGNLTQIEYYTSTGGIGNEIGPYRVYGRYTYRIDKFGSYGKKISTTYYNDPYPGNWDPEIEGIIIRDNFGRYFLQQSDGSKWLIIAR
ncbi:MAG: hypothetical protein NC908_04190, partial [Candidatus Omnitrophica bacterium]|nr:hypothetical protein [Candidatus Omnitrophota bacterium]